MAEKDSIPQLELDANDYKTDIVKPGVVVRGRKREGVEVLQELSVRPKIAPIVDDAQHICRMFMTDFRHAMECRSAGGNSKLSREEATIFNLMVKSLSQLIAEERKEQLHHRLLVVQDSQADIKDIVGSLDREDLEELHKLITAEIDGEESK